MSGIARFGEPGCFPCRRRPRGPGLKQILTSNFIQTVKQKSQFKREYATSLEANACRKREGADANSGRDRKGHNINRASCALKEDGVLKLQKHPQFI
jgi:hypothetical protein